MGVMSKIEAAMQGAVEGTFGRVFRTRVEPAELARKMERAMDSNLTLEIDRRVAPNVYDIFLSPQDMAYLGPNAGVWTTSIASGLIATARDRNYLMTTNPVVRLYEDPALGTGQTRVDAHLFDANAMAREGIEVSSASAEETRAINAKESAALAQELANARARQASTSIPPAWLTLIRPGRGQPMRIERQTVHLGRNTENEFVVPDKRVSRFHAEIRCENGQFYLYDLGSTNGVLLNGGRVTRPTALKNNDVVTVGSHEFVFQRR